MTSQATPQVTLDVPRRGRCPPTSTALAGRTLAALASPGGAVFLLAIALLVAIIAANPNFADPGVLIRFMGRTAPIAIAAMGQYFVIVSGEFDLSMGAVIATQVVIAGNLIGQDEDRILPGDGAHAAGRRADRARQRAGHHAAPGAELHRHPRHDARAARAGALPHRRRRDRQPARQLPRRSAAAASRTSRSST